MRYLLLLLSISLFATETKTSRTLELPSGNVAYEASLGSLPVKNEKGEPVGDLHYTAYCAEGTGRPLTFVFNGGPGSSSVWLHLGAFGPRRIISPEEGQSAAPPYAWVDNLETLLDVTDLVFVDPIGTGLSRAKTEEEAKQFYDSLGDVYAIGDFIRDFLTQKKRWNSPIYLAGESYGTYRVAGLANYLQEEHGVYLNGLILISCAVDFSTCRFEGDNILPYFLYFPTYATTAWFHGQYRPEASLEEVAEEARRFAYETYAPALLAGFPMNPMEKNHFYEKLAKMTGLPLSVVRKFEGRIDDNTFLFEFFSEEKKALGLFDTRLAGHYTDAYISRFELDPSFTSIVGIFSGAMHAYLEKELNLPVSYQIFSLEANQNWVYKGSNPLSPPNLTEALRRAMLQNPQLKIFVGAGYFDAATPFAATEYWLNHLNLPASHKARIRFETYAGGHMYYLSPSERIQFKQDLLKFYSTKD